MIGTMQEISQCYESHIPELGDLMRARYLNADDLGRLEEDELRIRSTRSLSIEGKNEAERKANLALVLETDEHYQDVARDIRMEKQRIASADIDIELTRLRMRLLGWQMEWLIAQKGADEEVWVVPFKVEA